MKNQLSLSHFLSIDIEIENESFVMKPFGLAIFASQFITMYVNFDYINDLAKH